ncbi:chordin-like protein 2 isoform X2 [Dunckerocampus dactyliophorus]|uniref:chordin-like protein 2 isoform X2 n=1 Tax=Dunckerocampus dactyliophorus TaxID=161453 RepID=UPI0024054D1E|nr:chordin-like protein 2 isoform X2 [Dunckerocampus dactyliophorus]
MKSLLVSLMLVWCAAAHQRGRKGSGVACTFKDKRFNPGDSWHPFLEPFGLMLCMRCSCTEMGHVKCSKIKCPPLPCDKPVDDPQQCCPKCTDEPKKPAGLRAPVKVCRYNGSIYQPGETFTKHDLPAKPSNECAMCSCSNGNIFCVVKTCQPISCASPVTASDTCCLLCKDAGVSGSSSAEDANQQLNRGVRHSLDQCPAEQHGPRSDRVLQTRVKTSPRRLSLSKLNLRGASETTVKILLQRQHQKACLYNGKTYSHGDTWHPVLGKVLECIMCSCSDGLQECKRITCPSQYPCPHPVKSPGKCCKACPERKAASNHTQCYSGYKNKLLVYKVESVMKVDSPSTVRIIAVERASTAEVEVHVWKAVDGVLQLMEIGDVQRKDIMDHPENYTLLTTVDEEMWGKFKEGAGKLDQAQTVCEDGIREMVTFLNPKQVESLCSP